MVRFLLLMTQVSVHWGVGLACSESEFSRSAVALLLRAVLRVLDITDKHLSRQLPSVINKMEEEMDLKPISNEERAKNKAARLKNAADPNDGLTIRMHDDGSVRVTRRSLALEMIKAGKADSAE